MFADLYDHRVAAVTYGLVTAGITALCIGFAVSLPVAIALGGGLLVATGSVVLANLSVTPSRMLAAGARSAGATQGDDQSLPRT
jgi:hypothetical protein